MENTQMLIGLDIDDTIADLVPQWIARYNNKYSDSLVVKEIIDWDISKFVKPECGKKIYDLLIKNLYDDVLPVFGAIKGIHALREEGHKIAYVTSFCPTTAGRKYEWLNQYHLLEKEDIYMETTQKGTTCKSLRIDIMVDDNAETIQNLYKTCTGILYNRSWNSMSAYNLRARSWKDVLDLIKRVNKIKESK
jgi:5'-nucleotidase